MVCGLVEFAEADSFFCFTNLMSEIRDFFIKTLDETDHGINTMMSMLMSRLKDFDLDVFHLFQLQDLKPQYYSFRYVISSTFSQFLIFLLFIRLSVISGNVLLRAFLFVSYE